MADSAPPGVTGLRVGVLGAGQLGRMLALAGIPLGLRFTFLSDVADPPAAELGRVLVGAYDDMRLLDQFAREVDLVTYEFENVPVAAVERLASTRAVWPPAPALAVTQDRVLEKETCARLGIPTAPFAPVTDRDELARAVARIGTPGIAKTRRFGYDGKGQYRITTPDEVDAAWSALGGAPLVYEGFVAFERELSVIAVRGRDGETRVYPLVENRHRDGILRRSIAPAASVADTASAQATEYARTLLRELEYIGVLAVELFETRDGLLVNEMAPRVHNSGHWTIEGAVTSQFENHVRAICGLPLGDCAAVGASEMLNIIGHHPDVRDVLRVEGAHLHLYGKSDRAGRKLGHVTVCGADAGEVTARVDTLARHGFPIEA